MNRFQQNEEIISEEDDEEEDKSNDEGEAADENDCCVVCLEKKVGAMFAPCAHKCCCYRDAKLIFKKSRMCPICRQVLEGVIKLEKRKPQ